MTREEAIRRMECCRDFLANNYSDMGEPNVTAFNMSIKSLEQEPCEDAVSRSAVIEALVDMRDGYPNPSGEMISDKTIVSVVNKLPSVTPKPKTDVLDKIRAEIEYAMRYQYAVGENDYAEGFEKSLEILDKYKAESEVQE